MANKPKLHDNRDCRAFLSRFATFGTLRERHPQADDVLTGAASLRTAGDGSTRNLNRRTLFRILRTCDVVSVENTQAVSTDLAKRQTAEKYTAAARVASRALAGLAADMPPLADDDPETWLVPDGTEAAAPNLGAAISYPYVEKLRKPTDQEQTEKAEDKALAMA